jgi:hypothetical protein
VSRLRRAAQRGGDSEITVLTTAKLRPVLVIAEAADSSFDGPAVLALRLRRFSKLTADEQAAVRGGETPRLFVLRPERFPGLVEENAAVLPALVRVARNALDETEDLGALDENELRVLHERIARYFNLDLTMLARRLLDERLRRTSGQEKP